MKQNRFRGKQTGSLLVGLFLLPTFPHLWGTNPLMSALMRKLLLALGLAFPLVVQAQQADTLQRLTPYQIENLREAGSELRAGSAKTVLGTAIGLLSIGAGAYIASKPATYSKGQVQDSRKTGLIVMGVGTAIGLTISIGGANNIASAGGWLRNLWRTSKPKEQIDWENSQKRKRKK